MRPILILFQVSLLQCSNDAEKNGFDKQPLKNGCEHEPGKQKPLSVPSGRGPGFNWSRAVIDETGSDATDGQKRGGRKGRRAIVKQLFKSE